MVNIDNYVLTPDEILFGIARNEKSRRKERKITQERLAEISGVSLGSIRRFEQTGDISLVSLLKIAIVLDETDTLSSLFSKNVEYHTMKELLDAKRHKG